jgi:uncharacterized CHY-type Zn-finger protein
MEIVQRHRVASNRMLYVLKCGHTVNLLGIDHKETVRCDYCETKFVPSRKKEPHREQSPDFRRPKWI